MENNVKLKVYQSCFALLVTLSASLNQDAVKLVDNAYENATNAHPEETDEDTLREYCEDYLNTLNS